MKGSGYGFQKFRDPQNELEVVYFGCLGYLRRKVLLGYFCWVVWIWSVFFAFLCQAVWWHQQVLWRNPEVLKEHLSNCLDDRTDDALWQGNGVDVFQTTMMMLGCDVSFLVVEVCEHLVSVTCFIVFYDVPSTFACRSVCYLLATPCFCFFVVFFGRQNFQVQLIPHHHLPCVFNVKVFCLPFQQTSHTWNWTVEALVLFKKLGNHQAEAGALVPETPQRSEISHQNYLENDVFFPKIGSKSHWKLLFGRRSFPFGEANIEGLC